MIDTCVCCGEYVPEGQQVCTSCQNIPKKHLTHEQLIPVACMNHDEKLSRTYNATGKTLIKL
jgi:predicted nucleic acid-binding Zn ribbon protein